jgi:hypothetical protein
MAYLPGFYPAVERAARFSGVRVVPVSPLGPGSPRVRGDGTLGAPHCVSHLLCKSARVTPDFLVCIGGVNSVRLCFECRRVGFWSAPGVQAARGEEVVEDELGGAGEGA